MSGPMALHRMTPNDPESWRLWPSLEMRMRRQCAPDGQTWETPADTLVDQCRRLWVQSPDLLGAWLIVEEGEPIGHLVAWVESYWGEPFIAIHHVHVDDGRTLLPVRGDLYAALHAWIADLNRAYDSAGMRERIRCLRALTDRPDAWCRYLGVTPTRTLTQVRIAVDELPQQETA